jgi:DNA-binding CsgD family transcriptional regulator
MIKLGLSSKEIAAVFNIAASSVEVARHRLRKNSTLTLLQA